MYSMSTMFHYSMEYVHHVLCAVQYFHRELSLYAMSLLGHIIMLHFLSDPKILLKLV